MRADTHTHKEATRSLANICHSRCEAPSMPPKGSASHIRALRCRGLRKHALKPFQPEPGLVAKIKGKVPCIKKKEPEPYVPPAYPTPEEQKKKNRKDLVLFIIFCGAFAGWFCILFLVKK